MDTILECNQNNADHVFLNGNFVSSFATAIPLFEGDQIVARLCSIDSQKSDTNTIIIDTDLNAVITYSYYDCDYDWLADKEQQDPDGTPWPALTYGYYAGYGEHQTLDLQSAEINMPQFPEIPGATYRFLAQMWFSWIDEDGVTQQNDITNDSGFSYAVTASFPSDDQEPNLAIPAKADDIRLRGGTLKLIRFVFQEGGMDLANPYSYYSPTENTYVVISQQIGLLLNTASITIPAGRYDPLEISQMITQQISSAGGVEAAPIGANQYFFPTNQCLLNVNSAAANNMFWVPITENAPALTSALNYRYIPGAAINLFFGADLMAIQYGVTGDIFQWSFGYTPHYNPASIGTRNVAVYTTGTAATNNLRYFMLTTASGITIHDLQPKSFWQGLGLYDVMITPLAKIASGPDIGISYFTYNNWNVPEEATSLNFFTPFFNRNTIPPVSGSFFDTDNINNIALLGSELTSNPTGGYYIVKAQFGAGTSNYIDNTNINDAYVSIVSTQYNTANTITGFADSAINYTHTGVPLLISRITIDILDPLTKKTAPQLGVNNTVVLQIIRAKQSADIIDPKGKPIEIPVPFILS